MVVQRCRYEVDGIMTLLSSELHSYMEWSFDSVRRPQVGNSEERKTRPGPIPCSPKPVGPSDLVTVQTKT